MTATTATAKRTIDVAVSSVALLLLAPLFAVIAAAIRLESRGPALFRQQRVGRDFQPFTILKFRTMRTGVPGPRITAGADPRITRMGRLLRAAKLDELPQLINVLRGEMSLVGPRPELPEYVARFRHQYAELLSVRPGLTDPASLAFSNEAEELGLAADPAAEYERSILPRKLEASRDYVRNLTVAGDIRLIALTALLIAGVRLKRPGERGSARVRTGRSV